MNDKVNNIAKRDSTEVMQPAVGGPPTIGTMETHALIPRMELARRLPRSPSLFAQRLQEEVLLDPGPMVYHKPGKDEDGKEIELIGPSIRMAEIAGRLFGNLDISEPIISESDGRVTAIVRVLDLESNYCVPGTSAVSLVTKNGRRMPPHVVSNLVLAAAAKAMRNAIEKVIGKHVLKEMVTLCLRAQVAAARAEIDHHGKEKFWADVLAAWAKVNITEGELFAALGIKDRASVTPEHGARLRACWTTIRQERVPPRVALGLEEVVASSSAAAGAEDDDFPA